MPPADPEFANGSGRDGGGTVPPPHPGNAPYLRGGSPPNRRLSRYRPEGELIEGWTYHGRAPNPRVGAACFHGRRDPCRWSAHRATKPADRGLEPGQV